MSGIASQLFEGPEIRFGPIDHEKDAEVESKWTHNAVFIGILRDDWLKQNMESSL